MVGLMSVGWSWLEGRQSESQAVSQPPSRSMCRYIGQYAVTAVSRSVSYQPCVCMCVNAAHGHLTEKLGTSTAALSSSALATRQAPSAKVLLAMDRAAALPISVLLPSLDASGALEEERPYRPFMCGCVSQVSDGESPGHAEAHMSFTHLVNRDGGQAGAAAAAAADGRAIADVRERGLRQRGGGRGVVALSLSCGEKGPITWFKVS